MTGTFVSPEGTAEKLPDVPVLNSICEFAVTVSERPSNFTAVAVGAAGRRGMYMLMAKEAGFPLAALNRMLSMRPSAAAALGIMLDMSRGFAATVVHEVPLALYSIRFDTPLTVSPRGSKATPVGNVSSLPGTLTLLINDDGAVAVALIRTKTVAAAPPNIFLGMLVSLAEAHVVPSFRLYSIADETPVILSTSPSYSVTGAAARAGTATVSMPDVNAVSVAFERT